MIFEDISSLVCVYNILPDECRSDFKIVWTTFKAKHRLVPSYITEYWLEFPARGDQARKQSPYFSVIA